MTDIKLIHGDSLIKLKELEDNSIDAVVTDPPYGLSFMGKKWDYDVPSVELWKECLRVLKPGAFLLSFAGTRTYHRMAINIEDAGFEIRDMISWLYGSGFPKSLNIGKQVDKIKGNEREVIGTKNHAQKDFKHNLYAQDPANRNNEKVFGYGEETLTKGNSEWEGWGTALKPACEPIVVARKPLSEKNVALNVLKWGTGGINIDACRIGNEERTIPIYSNDKKNDKTLFGLHPTIQHKREPTMQGRFPANIILDEEAGKILDEQAPQTGAIAKVKSGQKSWGGEIYHKFETSGDDGKTFYDNGERKGASRFFYCAKASKSERNLGCENMPLQHYLKENKMGGERDTMLTGSGNPRDCRKRNNHPTVKPIKLMEYLIKLVSKEGAVVLDPFLGSGTTLIACKNLNRKGIGIEREEDYIKIAEARIKSASLSS